MFMKIMTMTMSEAELTKFAKATNKTYSSSEIWFGRGIRYPLSSEEANCLGSTLGYGESPNKGIISLKRSRNETSTRVKKNEWCVFTNGKNFRQNDTVRPPATKQQKWVYLCVCYCLVVVIWIRAREISIPSARTNYVSFNIRFKAAARIE